MKQLPNSKAVFESLPVPAALRAMAIPTVISQIIVLIYNMADTFYIGRTENPYMVAAASLILPIFNLTLSLTGLAGIGGGTLISRLLGEDARQEAKRVSAFSIWLSIGLTAVFSLILAVFMRPLLYLLGAGENTYEFARQYAFCVIVIGGVPTVLSNVLSNLLRSSGASRQAGFGIAMGGILNILLDPLFMFVLLPRGQEVIGAGIATCLSNCFACLYFLGVIRRRRAQSVLGFRFHGKLPQKRSILSVFYVGIPASLTTLLFDLDYMVLDRLMVGYGDIALAAVGIVLKVERLPLNVGVGICQGMIPLVAYNYTSGNHKRMKQVVHHARLVGLIVAVCSIALYELGADCLIRFFIPDEQTVLLGAAFLRIRILATPLMFMSFFTVYLFQALGRGERALLLGVVRWAGFNIPMLFLLNRLIGMYGLVWSQTAADALAVILSFIVYGAYSRKHLNFAD